MPCSRVSSAIKQCQEIVKTELIEIETINSCHIRSSEGESQGVSQNKAGGDCPEGGNCGSKGRMNTTSTPNIIRVFKTEGFKRRKKQNCQNKKPHLLTSQGPPQNF